jgi:hypothetical protein
LNQLTKDLINATGSITTQNGGGEHGHMGMVVDEAEYITFSWNAAHFLVPVNPGPYPTVVNNDVVIHECEIAKHKAEIVKYKTYLGVENWLRRMVVKAIDHEWIAELESDTMGFNHLSPKALLTHLQNVRGSLDHMDVTKLISTCRNPGMESRHLHHFLQEVTDTGDSC